MPVSSSRIVALAASVVIAALATAPASFAQDKSFNLRISHFLPPSHPMHKAFEQWAASVQNDSGGTIKATIYPAEQLGKAFDHYDMVRDGIADMAFINPGYQTGRFSIVSAGQLPFLVADAAGGSQALDIWYRKYAEKEMADVKLCNIFFVEPGTFNSRNKRIATPDDIKGMKIRPAQSTVADWIKLLGGNNVAASAPEARDVLEKGVVDAITFPYGSVVLFGIDKVTKYHMDAPLYSSVQGVVLNKATYNSMSAAQKKVIDNHCNADWSLKIATPWMEFERAGRPQLQAQAGHEFVQLTPEQVAAWKKSAEPLESLWAEQVKKAGGDADTAMAELKTNLKKFNAMAQ